MIDEQKAALALEEKLKDIGDADAERQANYRKVFDTLDKHRFFYTNEYGEPTRYEFKIEVENGSDPIDLVSAGFQWLEDKLSNISPEIKQIEDGFYLLTFEEGEHTIGNLLQTMFFRHYVRGSQELLYVGYIVPHPLEKIMNMKLKLKDNVDLDELLSRALKEFQNIIADIRKDWELFTVDRRGQEVSQHLVKPKPKKKSNFVLPHDDDTLQKKKTTDPKEEAQKKPARKSRKTADASGDEEKPPPVRKSRKKESDAGADEQQPRKPRAKKTIATTDEL
jgi:DNA-directed RNA polymerase subunit L